MAAAQERGDYRRALELADGNVEYTRDRYGDVHYLYGMAHYNRNSALEQLGRREEARAAARTAVDILTLWRTQQPAYYARTVAALAYLDTQLGDVVDADLRAIEAARYAPPGSMEQAMASYVRGYSLRLRGDPHCAAVHLRAAVDTTTRLGSTYWSASFGLMLASTLRRAGDIGEATRALDSASPALERIAGPEGPRMSEVYGLRADLAVARGRFDGAEPFSRRAFAIAERALGLTIPSSPWR